MKKANLFSFVFIFMVSMGVHAQCSVVSLSALPGACSPESNTYNQTGTLIVYSAPIMGTLVLENSCGGLQSLSPPFSSPIGYTFTGLPANGLPCTVIAHFSADPLCADTANYVAPASCAVGISEEVQPFLNIIVSPNPSNGIFDLSFEQLEASEVFISISDIFGRTIHESKLEKANAYKGKVVDLGIVDTGIYFVKIANKYGSIIKKIICN